jgi:hypothetical protein
VCRCYHETGEPASARQRGLAETSGCELIGNAADALRQCSAVPTRNLHVVSSDSVYPSQRSATIQEYFPRFWCRLTLSAAGGDDDDGADCELRLPFSTSPRTIGRAFGPYIFSTTVRARPRPWRVYESWSLEAPNSTCRSFSCLAEAPDLTTGRSTPLPPPAKHLLIGSSHAGLGSEDWPLLKSVTTVCHESNSLVLSRLACVECYYLTHVACVGAYHL